jgi:hypothetical protein
MSAPRVIRTVPENDDRNIDPALSEIRVVFDSDMRADGYSFVGGGPAFPTPAGQPRWLDHRTCVLPVRLEPDHDYSFSINSERFTKFQGTDGVPAVPMPVTFHTAGRRDAVELSLEQVRAVISELRRAIHQHYSKGQELEGRGIAPDVFVGVDPASSKNGDPVLAVARKSLAAGTGPYR